MEPSKSETQSNTQSQSNMSSPPQDLEKQEKPADVDDKERWVVKFSDGDPGNPHNFKTPHKMFLTFQMSMLALSGSLGSSIVSAAQPKIAEQLHVSEEVSSLTLCLYVLGWAFGPMLWAPVSEVYGRKWGMLPAVFIHGLFIIGSATSRNIASLLVTRFFGGIFASAPISNVPAALGDIYTPRARGNAMTFVSLCIVGGPTLGPIIGAALTVNPHLGWRWTEYIEAIFCFAIAGLATLALPETYAPVLLARKARKLRKEPGNERYSHPHEKQKITPQNVLTKHINRPLRILFTEPMITGLAIYASFVYGLVYFTLEAFPIVFEEKRGWSLLVSTLPFLGVLIGVFCALFVNIGNQPYYARAMQKNNGKPVPEARLPPMIIGGVSLAGGLFWFGWTANPSIPWPVPVVAGGFIGAGFNIVYQQSLNFIVDAYGLYGASASSAITILRSLVAFGLPLAARPMFQNLGVGPGCSLLGGIAALALPVPVLLLKYTDAMRRRSKLASEVMNKK